MGFSEKSHWHPCCKICEISNCQLWWHLETISALIKKL